MEYDKNIKFFISGVTGQMGSYMADLLLSKGVKVFGGVRRLSTANYKNIEQNLANPDFKIVPFDLGDANSITSCVKDICPDYFINCAANSFVGSSWDFAEQHMIFNAIGVLHELEAIRRFAPKCRYINFGSSEEFGDVLFSPQNENHPPRARSPYGASKIAARQLVKVYRESYDLYALQCWCFNYESPRRGEEFVTRKIAQGVVRVAKEIASGDPISPICIGNTLAYRDWSHAKDIASGVLAMLEQPVEWVESRGRYSSNSIHRLSEFVLSSGEVHSIRELVEFAFSCVAIKGNWVGEGIESRFLLHEKDGYIKKVEGEELVKVDKQFFRPNEVSYLLGDSSLAKNSLEWHPKVSFKELIAEMVANENVKSNFIPHPGLSQR